MLAFFFFVIAIVRRSKPMFKLGTAVAIAPLSLYALTYWFYDVHIPRLNKQQEKAYAGSYTLIMNREENTDIPYEKQARLLLNADNTFELGRNDFINFHGKGTWRAGATDDGQFEFRDSNNAVLF